MKLKDILPVIYSNVELIDIVTDIVMISTTPERKQKLFKYMEQPVYALYIYKKSIRILTDKLPEDK